MAIADFIKVGQTYGFLTVTSEPFKIGVPSRKAVSCSCICGNTGTYLCKLIYNGHTKSCGCARKISSAKTGRAATKHGLTHGPEWQTYYSMLQRCRNPDHKSYARYGGRGISICDRWLESFENFVADMGMRPEGMTLERSNTDGGYSLDNCRWATWKEQATNRSNTVLLEAFGEKLTASDWSRKTGIERATIVGRIKKNWPIELALSHPPMARGKRNKLPF